jgi:hypothetical protein
VLLRFSHHLLLTTNSFGRLCDHPIIRPLQAAPSGRIEKWIDWYNLLYFNHFQIRKKECEFSVAEINQINRINRNQIEIQLIVWRNDGCCLTLNLPGYQYNKIMSRRCWNHVVNRRLRRVGCHSFRFVINKHF